MQNQTGQFSEGGARSRRLGYTSIQERIEHAASAQIQIEDWARPFLGSTDSWDMGTVLAVIMEILSYSEVIIHHLPAELHAMGFPVSSVDPVGAMLEVLYHPGWFHTFLMRLLLDMRKETVDSALELIAPEES